MIHIISSLHILCKRSLNSTEANQNIVKYHIVFSCIRYPNRTRVSFSLYFKYKLTFLRGVILLAVEEDSRQKNDILGSFYYSIKETIRDWLPWECLFWVFRKGLRGKSLEQSDVIILIKFAMAVLVHFEIYFDGGDVKSTSNNNNLIQPTHR